MKRVPILTIATVLTAVPAFSQSDSKPATVSETQARLSIKYKVDPEYPATARQFHLFGVVVAQITVGPDGKVESVDDASGNQILQGAVKSALRKWVFSPFLVDGKPSRVKTSMTFSFRL